MGCLCNWLPDNIKLKKTKYLYKILKQAKNIFQDDVSIFSLVPFPKKAKPNILQLGQELK